MTETADPLRDLSPQEVRVLGCLVEKEATTPDAYPLTLNSLRNACNQSTSRDPVVSYTDHDVEQALAALRGRGLTRTVHSTSNRATKYRHVLGEVFGLEPPETALLSVLMLRGPQTTGELKGRSERQHRFESTDEVAATLTALAEREQPLVRRLERRPGQKDARWAHLLGGEPVDDDAGSPAVGRTETGRSAGADRHDAYGEATAEFYDLLETGMWDTLGIEMLEVLEGVDPADGPIVDIGSGTGIGLAYLHAAVPGARIVAIEPSKAMRVALHTRLAESPELRDITTVLPTALADAPLPERASAVVVSATLGHLSPGERELLWRYVAERMPAGAPAVIGILPPDRPLHVDLVRYCRRPVGDLVYEGWQSGEPIDERSMSWTMIYKVVHGDTGETIAEYAATAPWHCDGVDDVAREVARYGLTLTARDDYVIVRRS